MDTASFAELNSSKSVPASGFLYTLIPFCAFVLFSLGFSVTYVLYFWKRHEKDRLSAVVSIFGLFITMLTAYLLPIDVFLVSYMKNPDGSFKAWATNETIQTVENSLTHAYYGFYSGILLFLFFLLPLVYFAYEETDDDQSLFCRLIHGLRYTSVFFLFAVVLILVGAFLPYEHFHSLKNDTENLTPWEKMELLYSDVTINKGSDALSFVMNILTFIGMIGVMIYTAIGMSSFSVGNIGGWLSRKKEKVLLDKRRTALEDKINELKAKEDLGSIRSSDLEKLQDYEDQFRIVLRMQREAEMPSSRRFETHILIRTLGIIVGVLSVAFGLLLCISLFLVNLEKVLRSSGYYSGYFIIKMEIFNPLNYIMIKAHEVFPLDYVLYFLIIIFLIICTVSGIRYIGIWCFCVRLFRIRPHHTEPQALIMLCGTLMYVVLALNILMYETMPQYTTFGNQHYLFTNSSMNITKVCDHAAPEGACTMTRASTFILSYAVKVSFFSSIYYYCSWVFLGFVIVGFFIFIIKKKKSFIGERFDMDDFEDSDMDDRPLVP